mgnify:CR=1 FL=1
MHPLTSIEVNLLPQQPNTSSLLHPLTSIEVNLLSLQDKYPSDFIPLKLRCPLKLDLDISSSSILYKSRNIFNNLFYYNGNICFILF